MSGTASHDADWSGRCCVQIVIRDTLDTLVGGVIFKAIRHKGEAVDPLKGGVLLADKRAFKVNNHLIVQALVADYVLDVNTSRNQHIQRVTILGYESIGSKAGHSLTISGTMLNVSTETIGAV